MMASTAAVASVHASATETTTTASAASAATARKSVIRNHGRADDDQGDQNAERFV
jgi:hypothetical protein